MLLAISESGSGLVALLADTTTTDVDSSPESWHFSVCITKVSSSFSPFIKAVSPPSTSVAECTGERDLMGVEGIIFSEGMHSPDTPVSILSLLSSVLSELFSEVAST